MSATPSRPVAPGGPGGPDPMAPARFRAWLGAVGALALLIELRLIDSAAATPLGAAATGARIQATWLVRGYWFVDPGALVPASPARHLSALHPPLTVVALAVADVASATGVTAQRVLFALVFVGAVLVAGLCGRQLAGGRAGVLAALVVATAPSLWRTPVTLGPETLVIALTCLLLYGVVRFAQHPSLAGAAEVGAYLGLCVLTRTDLVALVVLVGLPAALLARPATWPARAAFALAMLAVTALVVAPWAGRNLATFPHPPLLADDAGPVLAGANCAPAYGGPLEGWWSATCATAAEGHGDQPRRAGAQWAAGRTYASAHAGELPSVLAWRVGRLWGVVDPLAVGRLEAGPGSPAWLVDLGTWYLYALAPLAVLGALVLRRRRQVLVPFVAMVVLATATAALAYGDPRYRVEADAAMAILAGVALDALARRVGRRSGAGAARGRHAPAVAPRSRASLPQQASVAGATSAGRGR